MKGLPMLELFVARFETIVIRMNAVTSIAWITFEQGKSGDHVAALDLLIELELLPRSTKYNRSAAARFTQYTIEFPSDELNNVRDMIADFN
jgi:hypothetical protein